MAMLDIIMLCDEPDRLPRRHRVRRWLAAWLRDPLEDRLAAADLERLRQTSGLMD